VARVPVHMRARARACVCVCVCARARACVRASLQRSVFTRAWATTTIIAARSLPPAPPTTTNYHQHCHHHHCHHQHHRRRHQLNHSLSPPHPPTTRQPPPHQERLLEDINSIDYDVEDYARRLDEILKTKIDKLTSLRESVTDFRAHLQQEEEIAKKVSGRSPQY
jgi:hypothetical protein